MILSIWRYSHLTLALISAAFLIILSVTGTILAFDAVEEKTHPYKVENIDKITLAQSLPILLENYSEIVELKVDHNGFVSINAIDNNGNNIQAYIDPFTGNKIADLEPKSQFIQWTTSLHRSLFLKETGRTVVAIISFLLVLISISGFVLILKRQKHIGKFFGKINKEFFAQYYHVIAGRLLLIPILIIAITGTILFLTRLEFFKSEATEIIHKEISGKNSPRQITDIEFFKTTKLQDVERIEFPFIINDETEPYIVHLKEQSFTINQVNGNIISETKNPYPIILEKINIDLHTGRTHVVWAIILGFASINILFFIYTGFTITLRRKKNKISNKYTSNNAEIIILVGSENGNTLFFANHIQKQLIALGKKVFLCEMNKYTLFPKAEHIIILTSTYGLGDHPSNASNFKNLVLRESQLQKINYSVIGFGSKSYADYCAYAKEINQFLNEQQWANKYLELVTVNERSADEFVEWIKLWNEKSGDLLVITPNAYEQKINHLKSFKVVEKTQVQNEDNIFKILLKPSSNQKFDSGDILAIYPSQKENVERLYSISKLNNHIQLIVKLHKNGLGSNYLYNLQARDIIKAKVIDNQSFHLPKDANRIIMIANGTGIAPFFGMIESNINGKIIDLYLGVKYDNSTSRDYRQFADTSIKKNKLQKLHFAFSREGQKLYVTDLISRDSQYFAEALENGTIIMICGSLNMQKDVEEILDDICLKINRKPLQYYISRNQTLSDCY